MRFQIAACEQVIYSIQISELIQVAPMNSYCLLFLFALVLFTAGCGSREFVPVSGSIELEGKPLEGATVTFHCKEKDSYAVGQTDAKGEFKLATNNHHDQCRREFRRKKLMWVASCRASH